MTPEYLVSVRSEKPIPHDVLVEHIAVSLRDFKESGKLDVQMAHPFDDKTNVVFDDDVKTEEYAGPNAGPADPYPFITRALDALKGNKRG